MSDYLENATLKLLLQGIAITGLADNAGSAPFTNLYLSLHSADPGDPGTQATNEIAYGGYARVAVARSTAGWTVVNNAANLAAIANFPQGTSGGGVATHWALGVAASGATNVMFKGVIGSAVGPFTAATTGTFTIPGSGLVVNDRVTFLSVPGSSLPTGITEGALYFVASVSGDGITISTTQGGSAVAITASGDGLAFKDVGVNTGANITPQLGTGTTITLD
jgi:hypothetical protein